MLIFLEAAMLAGMAVLGGICAYTDLKNGIVPNRTLLLGFLGGFIFHTLLLIFGAAPYYPIWLLNMAIADAMAFALFANKLWAAGDSKLFMTLYFLMPPTLLDAGSLTYCIVPYIFIFLPALVWVLGDTVVRLIRKEPRRRQSLHIREFLIRTSFALIETTALYCILFIAFRNFTQENELLISFVIMIYAYFCGGNKWMQKWYTVVLHAAVIAAVALLGYWHFSTPNWISAGIVIMILLFQRFAGMYNYQQIPTADVRKGMILSADTVIQFQKSRIRTLPADPSEEITARITEEEANSVRKWKTSVNGKDTIWIVRKIPFAVMIALGFILWSIVRIVR